MKLKHIHMVFLIGFLLWTVAAFSSIVYPSYVCWDGCPRGGVSFDVYRAFETAQRAGAFILFASIGLALFTGARPRRRLLLGFGLLALGLMAHVAYYVIYTVFWGTVFEYGVVLLLRLALTNLWLYLICVGLGIMVFGDLLPREHLAEHPMTGRFLHAG